MGETLLQSLNASLAKSGGSVHIATHGEISALEHAVMIKTSFNERAITGILDDWSVVMLAVSHGEGQRAHLVGELVGTIKIRITSMIWELSLTQGFALTQRGSVYQLGHQRAGEPDLNKVLALAKTIASWRGIQL